MPNWNKTRALARVLFQLGMILRGWLYRGQWGPWDEFRTMSFILEESVYDFEHDQNATVCLYLNLTMCLFIHTIIPYFYSKGILLTRVKTLKHFFTELYSTALVHAQVTSSNTCIHILTSSDFLDSAVFTSLKEKLHFDILYEPEQCTNKYYTRIFQHKTICEVHTTDVID